MAISKLDLIITKEIPLDFPIPLPPTPPYISPTSTTIPTFKNSPFPVNKLYDQIMIQTQQSRHHAITNLLEPSLSQLDQSKLISIIHSLLDKSRTLIQSLEQALKKLQQSEREVGFWRDRYYSFKHNCEMYAVSPNLSPSFNESKVVQIAAFQEFQVGLQPPAMQKLASNVSPRFGETTRCFISGVHETSFGRESNYRTESRTESLQSTDRCIEERVLGPKHISRFRFSNRKQKQMSY